MVNVIYRGQNYLLFGRTRIVNGNNEIPEEEFYKLMKYPTFALRISNRQLQVPEDFPLEPPKSPKKDNKVESKQKSEEQEETEDHEGDDEHSQDRLSVKQTLKNIQKSDDAEYLKGLIESDDRQKVKDAAQKRLDALESEDKE